MPVRTLFGWAAHFLHEQIKPAHEEEELEQASVVEINADEEAQLSRALAEDVYQEDIAKSVQKKMLEEPHDEVMNPEEDHSFGFVPQGKKKTTP